MPSDTIGCKPGSDVSPAKRSTLTRNQIGGPFQRAGFSEAPRTCQSRQYGIQREPVFTPHLAKCGGDKENLKIDIKGFLDVAWVVPLLFLHEVRRCSIRSAQRHEQNSPKCCAGHSTSLAPASQYDRCRAPSGLISKHFSRSSCLVCRPPPMRAHSPTPFQQAPACCYLLASGACRSNVRMLFIIDAIVAQLSRVHGGGEESLKTILASFHTHHDPLMKPALLRGEDFLCASVPGRALPTIGDGDAPPYSVFRVIRWHLVGSRNADDFCFPACSRGGPLSQMLTNVREFNTFAENNAFSSL